MIESELLNILACPICKSNLECANEKLVCTNCKTEYPIEDSIPIMLPSILGSDLRITTEKWDEEYRKCTQVPKIDPKNPELQYSYRHIKKRLRLVPPGPFLEAGCGLAKNSCLLAREGVKVVGLDISMTAVKSAKQLFENEGQKGYFVCSDMLHLPFKDNSFSLIYAGGAIEHFKDTLGAVRELRRCLKREGMLSATVPSVTLSLPYLMFRGNIPDVLLLNKFLEFFHLKLAGGRLMKFGYEKSFTIKKIIGIFTKAGFDHIKADLFETYYLLTLLKYDPLKKVARRLARTSLFWPMIYVDGVK